MKNIIKYLAVPALFLLAFSCTPEYMEPDKASLPEAGKLTPVITVDQQTNYVTFSIKETGVVPMWIFGEDKVNDGKTNKTYAYTGNGISFRVRDAGVHSVEVKAYNAHGISLGSKVVEYSLENTYRDPFDPSPVMRKMANTWVWNSGAAGHFGCGESGTDGLGWWSAGADEKAGWSLYDDRITFTEDGQYTYDPVDGQVYVNKESGFKNEYNTNDGNDYVAPIEAYTHSYRLENNWNEAGIEEIFLVLEDGDNLSYIPNPEALANPRYKVLEYSSKRLDFVYDNGAIAWRYQFVPYVKTLSPEEILAGTDESGKVWIMDNEASGHLACGPMDNPAGWWSAGANEKDNCGLYDNEIAFFPDGTYKFNPGPDNSIYVNWGCTTVGPNTGAEPDNVVAWETQTGKYSFDGEAITLPANFTVGYIPSDAAYENPVFHVASISETKLVLWYLDAGCSWQLIFKARDVQAPSVTIAGVPVENGSAKVSLTNGQTVAVTGIDLSTYWIDPDFFEPVDAANVKFIGQDGEYMVMNVDNPAWLKVIPTVDGEVATWDSGKALWVIGEGAGKPQGAAPGWVTGPAADLPLAKTGADTYQITLWLTSGTNIKLFGQADWGVEWTSDKLSAVTGGILETQAADGNLHAVAGMEEGWYVMTVKDTGDGILSINVDRKKETYFDIDGESNLWKKAVVTPELWYSPADWSGGLNPEFELIEGNGFNVTVPAGTGGAEWMGQTKLHGGFASSSEKIYDFCCTLVCDEDATVTIKLTGNPEADGDVNTFFYDGNVALEAGVPLTYKKVKLTQAQSNDDFTIIFDFGRVPVGKTVSASQICFQEHLEK